MALILLDTTVAAGVFSDIFITKQGTAKHLAWKQCVLELMHEVPDAKITIPTPVFYELSSWSKEMHEALSDVDYWKKRSPFFKYIDYSIPYRILFAAAHYKILCSDLAGDRQDKRSNKQKISFIDALLASYCLTYNYFIITTNQRDFCPSYFQDVKIVKAPLLTDKSERQVIYLLKPKKWQKIKFK